MDPARPPALSALGQRRKEGGGEKRKERKTKRKKTGTERR